MECIVRAFERAINLDRLLLTNVQSQSDTSLCQLREHYIYWTYRGLGNEFLCMTSEKSWKALDVKI
jgi:hypothetical protein